MSVLRLHEYHLAVNLKWKITTSSLSLNNKKLSIFFSCNVKEIYLQLWECLVSV